MVSSPWSAWVDVKPADCNLMLPISWRGGMFSRHDFSISASWSAMDSACLPERSTSESKRPGHFDIMIHGCGLVDRGIWSTLGSDSTAKTPFWIAVIRHPSSDHARTLGTGISGQYRAKRRSDATSL